MNGPDTDPRELPTRICDTRTPPGMGGFAEGQANARLIAASPDLLAALESLIPAFEKCHLAAVDLAPHLSISEEKSALEALRAARAALVKAEGAKSAGTL